MKLRYFRVSDATLPLGFRVIWLVGLLDGFEFRVMVGWLVVDEHACGVNCNQPELTVYT